MAPSPARPEPPPRPDRTAPRAVVRSLSTAQRRVPRSWTGTVFVGMSLDGFVARDDGDRSRLTDPPTDPHHVRGHAGPTPPPTRDRFLATVDHVVMGRGTYEAEIARGRLPATKDVVVLSTTLPAGRDARITVLRDIPSTVAFLARARARGVSVEGASVARTFLREDLVDELIVTVAPVLLGSGVPLFGALPGEVGLTHLGTASGDHGTTTSRYRVRRD